MCRTIPLCLAVFFHAVSANAQAPQALELPVVFHAAPGTVFDSTSMLADAQRHFADAGLHFRSLGVRALPERFSELRSIRDRHRLKRHLVSHAINIFVHRAIHDRTPSGATRRAADAAGIALSGRLGGAHIPAPKHRPATYIILLASKHGLTLAHELGHFLGVAHHRAPDNIMSYGRLRTHFSARQLRVFRATARRLLRRRVLRRQSLPGRTNSRARPSAEVPASEIPWTKRANGSLESRYASR